jgi:hypothetical protein
VPIFLPSFDLIRFDFPVAEPGAPPVALSRVMLPSHSAPTLPAPAHPPAAHPYRAALGSCRTPLSPPYPFTPPHAACSSLPLSPHRTEAPAPTARPPPFSTASRPSPLIHPASPRVCRLWTGFRGVPGAPPIAISCVMLPLHAASIITRPRASFIHLASPVERGAQRGGRAHQVALGLGRRQPHHEGRGVCQGPRQAAGRSSAASGAWAQGGVGAGGGGASTMSRRNGGCLQPCAPSAFSGRIGGRADTRHCALQIKSN